MRNLKFCMLLMGVLLAWTGCKDKEVPGCTDATSLNFNADATVDDGSCTYLADNFVGAYTATDTIVYTNPNDSTLMTYFETNHFNIARTGATTVRITTFRGNCTLDGTVTDVSLTLPNAGTQCNMGQFACYRVGTSLHYSYAQANGVTEYVRGTAGR